MLPSPIRLAGLALIVAAIILGGTVLHGDRFARDARAASSPASQADLPGPRASVEAKLRAYATRCAPLGRPADARVRGSDFAVCIGAMARLGSGRLRSPRYACRALSAKRVRGQFRSEHARCVAAGWRVLRDRRRAVRKRAGGRPVVDPPDGAAEASDDVTRDDDDPDPQPATDDTGATDPDTQAPDDGGSDPDVVIEEAGDEPGA